MLRNIFRTGQSYVPGLFVVNLLVALTPALMSQTAGTGALTGTVIDASRTVVVNATVTATASGTGQARKVTTGTDGTYKLELPPGEYHMKFEAAGFKTVEMPSATVKPGETAVLDEKLEAGIGGLVPPTANEQTTGKPTAPAPEQLPNAPSSNTTTPSLSDLGLTPEQTQGNAREQALLDKRTHMLKVHQRLGLITTIPLIVTVATSLNAGGKNTSSASRDLHTALGAVTGDLYFMTAYYAIRAPRVPGTETRGPIRFHKAMAWIHGPGMILTPILGAIAFQQKNNGEKVHGIASAHGPVAFVTAGAFGAALMSVSLKF
jgi:Carboxypeptidase regulatory-like domain